MSKFSASDLQFFAQAIGTLDAAFRKAESRKAEDTKAGPPVVEGPAPMDLVLACLGAPTRERAIVEEVVANSVLLKRKDREPEWYSPAVITDVLGQADNDELLEFGYEIPEKVELKTGAYVVCVGVSANEQQFHMVEVDRVGSQYIWRFVGDSKTRNMTEKVANVLYPFSDPDEPNNMVAEPGIYYVPCHGITVEVIPFEGASLFRLINSSQLFELTAEMTKDMLPIESDTLDINAVAIIPENREPVAPENLEAAPGNLEATSDV